MAGFTSDGIVLRGLPELERKLNELTGKELTSVVKTSASAGMAPVRREIKTRMKSIKRTGFMADLITTKTKVYSDGSTVVSVVGVKADARRTFVVEVDKWLKDKDVIARRRSGGEITKKIRVDPSKYLHLIELGTKPHVIKNAFGIMTVQHPGTKGKHIMVRSFKAKEGEILGRYRKGLKRGLLRIAKKRAKGARR